MMRKHYALTRRGMVVVVCAATAVLVMHARPCEGQQPRLADTANRSPTGAYDFWFTPSNGDQVSGQFVISRRLGRYGAVFTSPKLQEPVAADSIGFVDDHVFISVFAGGYTFDFRVRGDSIFDATFTKTMRGVSERGILDLKRVERKQP